MTILCLRYRSGIGAGINSHHSMVAEASSHVVAPNLAAPSLLQIGEDGQNATMIVRGGDEVELREDAAYVSFDRLLAEM